MGNFTKAPSSLELYSFFSLQHHNDTWSKNDRLLKPAHKQTKHVIFGLASQIHLQPDISITPSIANQLYSYTYKLNFPTWYSRHTHANSPENTAQCTPRCHGLHKHHTHQSLPSKSIGISARTINVFSWYFSTAGICHILLADYLFLTRMGFVRLACSHMSHMQSAVILNEKNSLYNRSKYNLL